MSNEGMRRDARETVLQRLEAEEIASREAAQKEQEERDRQARRDLFWASDNAELAAVEQLRKLSAKYEERAELARAAIKAIAEFAQAELEITKELARIRGELTPHWNVTLKQVFHQGRFEGLRHDAGLPQNHKTLGIETPTERGELVGVTTIAGVMSGAIVPGMIIAGPKSLNFTFPPGGKI